MKNADIYSSQAFFDGMLSLSTQQFMEERFDKIWEYEAKRAGSPPIAMLVSATRLVLGHAEMSVTMGLVCERIKEKLTREIALTPFDKFRDFPTDLTDFYKGYQLVETLKDDPYGPRPTNLDVLKLLRRKLLEKAGISL